MVDPLLALRVAVVTTEIARSLPAEVAGAVVFLPSDLASHLTGTVIEVGEGRHI
jgi:hypothetical protein